MKPCPFCKGRDITIGYNGQPAIQYYGVCLRCEARGPIVDAPFTQVNGDEIVRRWDDRANDHD